MTRRRLARIACVLGATALGLSAWAYRHVTQPDYQLRRGREALHASESDVAESYAARLERGGHPDHARLLRGEALYLLGRFCLEDNRRREALPLFSQSLDELNQIKDEGALRLEAAALVGQCLLYLGNPREAERAFHFVLEHNPDQVDAHRGLAALYYDLGALLKAVDHLREVARLDPRDARPHRLMGLIAKDLDAKDQAADDYREALRRAPDGPQSQDVRVELAEVLVKQTRYGEALEVLERAAGAKPAEVRALRGECLWAQGRATEARSLLDEALATYPRHGGLLALRAKIHLAEDEPEAAAALLERLLSLAPFDPAGLYQRAQAYEAVGKKAEAAEQRRRAQEIQDDFALMTALNQDADRRPWDAEVRLRLAELCKKLGKQPEAAMWRQAAGVCGATPKAEKAGP